MTSNDRIGNHGEFVFQALISRRCRSRFYFHPIHLGEKHPITDMVVELLDTTGIHAMFYVQVKSTSLGYTGIAPDEMLRIEVSSTDIERLKKYPVPTYVAGIDIVNGRGFLGGIVESTYGGINGLPTRHPINCKNIGRLWEEVNAYWNGDSRPIPMNFTAFGI
jgi:hypothetical protein